jgi:hypothetical protein
MGESWNMPNKKTRKTRKKGGKEYRQSEIEQDIAFKKEREREREREREFKRSGVREFKSSRVQERVPNRDDLT